MSRPIIEVENLSKRYRLGQFNAQTMREEVQQFLARFRKNDIGGDGNSEFWALKDVSFSVQPGEIVGIIGRNGAGKSTLLKILSRITQPTGGWARIRGRIASLLEVGTGFHPELTGRENIYLNGAVLGMTRLEISRKFDEIVDFSGVEKFLETPVKRYSSGMYVRLAFAVAAHLDPEILLVDEVLAVGDADFQKKCVGKMGEVAHGGRTILFVSHNMGAVRRLTQTCLYLEEGRLFDNGPASIVIDRYMHRRGAGRETAKPEIASFRRDPNQKGPVMIEDVRTVSEGSIPMGAALPIEIDIRNDAPLKNVNVTVKVKRLDGETVSVVNSLDRDWTLNVAPGRHTVIVQIERVPFVPGEYAVDVGLSPNPYSLALDVIVDFPLFQVVNRGQVVHWLERPWGIVHHHATEWRLQTSGLKTDSETIGKCRADSSFA
jgi:lipopolysaccharide transport system ATP-binding protein